MNSGSLSRRKGLDRGKGLKRTRMKSKKLRIEPPDPEQREREDAERLAFKMAAAGQVVCAVCGRGGSFDAHHVIEQQELKDRGLWLWDPRNALRLCDRPDMGCHQQHTYKGGDDRVPLTKLRTENLDYAFEALGAYAYDYLKRRYSGEDPRAERRLEETTRG